MERLAEIPPGAENKDLHGPAQSPSGLLERIFSPASATSIAPKPCFDRASRFEAGDASCLAQASA
jgi:hypothetical protein